MAKCIITFPSVYHAFRAKKILEQGSIEVELTPIPRELSASCEGLAARIDEASLEMAVEMLENQNVVMLKKGIKVSR